MIDDYYISDGNKPNRKAWYLMRKARPFWHFCNKRTSLTNKLKYLIRLSEILCSLHKEECSHRDIKLGNLLFLDGDLVLSDFGLIWTIGDEIITNPDERIGPSFIGPIELEHRASWDSDFRPSDVYLLSKVVWMVIKDDRWGFRGEYKRSNLQFYLNPKNFGVYTFEPIHRLLERATRLYKGDRISIEECRKLLKQQYQIAQNESDQKDDWIIELRHKELEQEAVNKQPSDGVTFSNFWKIQNILNEMLETSVLINSDTGDKMNVDGFNEWMDSGSLLFQKYLNNNEVIEYLCYPKEIKYDKDNERFEIHLNSFQKEEKHKGFVTYNENKKSGLGPKNKKILLNEQIILHMVSKASGIV